MADRWQDDPNSSIGPSLAEVARYRRELDRTEQVAAAPAAHRFEAAERAPPPDGDLLEASGIDAEHLEHTR